MSYYSLQKVPIDMCTFAVVDALDGQDVLSRRQECETLEGGHSRFLQLGIDPLHTLNVVQMLFIVVAAQEGGGGWMDVEKVS